MGGQHEDAHAVRAVLLQALADRDDVAEGLAHLLFAQCQPAVVYPVLHERADTCVALALGNLVFVVGEDQVLTAAVDVELRAQIAVGHGRALDMPAGASGPPGALPRRFSGLGAFPECEVGGVSFLLGRLDAGIVPADRVDVAPGELSVVGVAADAIVDVATFDGVGAVVLDQLLYHFDDLRYLLCGARVDVGGRDIELSHLLLVLSDELLRDRVEATSLGVGLQDDAVVDVRVVLDVLQLVAAVLEVTSQHVENDV